MSFGMTAAGMVRCFPTLGAKTEARLGWGTRVRADAGGGKVVSQGSASLHPWAIVVPSPPGSGLGWVRCFPTLVAETKARLEWGTRVRAVRCGAKGNRRSLDYARDDRAEEKQILHSARPIRPVRSNGCPDAAPFRRTGKQWSEVSDQLSEKQTRRPLRWERPWFLREARIAGRLVPGDEVSFFAVAVDGAGGVVAGWADGVE